VEREGRKKEKEGRRDEKEKRRKKALSSGKDYFAFT
jgi:hypothetical protein